MHEVLDYYRDEIESSDIVSRLDLKRRGYFIVSLHREENVDSKERLGQLLTSLNALAKTYDMPVIVSTHPRTRQRLQNLNGPKLDSRIRALKPFGFHDYNNLQMNAFCAISDSGTIAEESSILDFPAITPRDAIERPEAMDTGNIIVTGLSADRIIDGVDLVTRLQKLRLEKSIDGTIPADYTIKNTAERVVKLIIGTAKLSNAWDNIRMHDYTLHV